MNKAILLILVLAGLSCVEPHGYVLSPLSRTSIFRQRDTNGAQPPFWWNDTGVWCGNVQQVLETFFFRLSLRNAVCVIIKKSTK